MSVDGVLAPDLKARVDRLEKLAVELLSIAADQNIILKELVVRSLPAGCPALSPTALDAYMRGIGTTLEMIGTLRNAGR